MNRLKKVLFPIVAFLLGVIVGGLLFSETQRRSFLALSSCQGTCLNANELVGLVASVGINKASGILPGVVKETDKTIVLKHPTPNARIHYIVIPKKDIKNAGDISDDDREYIFDAFKVTGEMIREQNLVDYQLVTNGPGRQGVTYLHFHLLSR